MTFTCPVRRYMNTLDYNDVKIEILLNYDIMALYGVTDEAPPKDNPDKPMPIDTNLYGFTDVLQMKILTQAFMYGFGWTTTLMIGFITAKVLL